MAQEILVNIQVSSKKADDKLKRTGKEVDKIAAATKKLAYEQSEEGKSVALLNEQYLNQRRINKELAREKLGLNKEVVKEGIGQRALAKAKQKLNFLRSEEALEVQRVNEQIKIQNNLNTAVIKSEMGLASTKASLNAQGKQFRTQAGLNNAILLETGRLASDASFGFTAIANNLSQIVSLGGSFIQTTGSFKSALGELRKSLFGVGGLLLGFQILIGLLQAKSVQDFIKSLGGLTGRLKVLSDLTKGYSDELGGLLGKFDTYVAIAQDSTRSEEQKAIALKKLNEEYPEYNAQLLKEGTNLKGINDENERFIKLLKERALSRAAESKIEEIASEYGLKALETEIDLIKVRADQKSQEARLDRLKENERSVTNDKLIADQIRLINFTKTRIENLESEKEEFGETYEEQRKIIVDFIQLEDEEDKKKGARTSNRFKVFKERLLQLEKVEEGYRKRSQKADLQTNMEILAQAQQNSMAELDILEEQFLRREETRLADYKRDINERKISDEKKRELIAQAEATFNDEVRKAGEDRAKVEEEILNYISSLRTLQIRRDANIAEREYDQMMEVQRAFAMESTKVLQTGLGDDELYFQERAKLIEDNIERQEGIVNAFAEGTLQRANAERELFKLQDQLRTNDLKKEKSTIAEKQRINMQYVNFAQGIGQLLKTLAGENKALQDAALVVEKGAAIAGVVVNASKSIATTRAQASAVPLLLPPLGLPNPAKPIAEADALRNIALTKVSAGLAIANILATTLTSFKRPTGAASGGASTAPKVQAPAFNVVGASATNQLAQAVGSNIPQVLPVVFDSDVSDINNINDANTGQDSGGERSIG